MITKHFSIWTKVMILDRDNHLCVYCGQPAGGVDHVIPLSQGGKSISSNGVACCISCNKIKYNHPLEKYVTKGLERLISHGEDVSWIQQLPHNNPFYELYGDGIIIGLLKEGVSIEKIGNIMGLLSL